MRALLILLLLFGAGPALARDGADENFYDALGEIARACDDPSLDLPSPHVIQPERQSKALLRVLLRLPPARCPGTVEKAVAALMDRLGPAPGGDVDLELAATARSVAERGIGMARDPDMADRLARLIWLLDDSPPNHSRLNEEELRQWAIGPEALTLLEARNADQRIRTRRSINLHADILLRRDHPAYDPAKAAALLEDSRIIYNREGRNRLVELLTSGVHLKPDYMRAARPFLGLVTSRASWVDEVQGDLLKIGRAAASAARTRAELADALFIVSASALDGRLASHETQADLLRRIGRTRKGSLTPAQVLLISEAMDERFGSRLPGESHDDPAVPMPIRLRALIGPDGRVVLTELLQSSGSPTRDRDIMSVWIEHGRKVEIPEISKGRFAWVELPEVDPKLTVFQVWDAKRARREAVLLAKIAEARRLPAPRAEQVNQPLVDALEELARFYTNEIQYTKAEPVLRELASLFPLERPRDLALKRMFYEEWFERMLRYRGHFDEAKRMETERLARKARLEATDPLAN